MWIQVDCYACVYKHTSRARCACADVHNICMYMHEHTSVAFTVIVRMRVLHTYTVCVSSKRCTSKPHEHCICCLVFSYFFLLLLPLPLSPKRRLLPLAAEPCSSLHNPEPRHELTVRIDLAAGQRGMACLFVLALTMFGASSLTRLGLRTVCRLRI